MFGWFKPKEGRKLCTDWCGVTCGRHGRESRANHAEYRDLAVREHEGLATRLGQAGGFNSRNSTPVWVQRLGTQPAGTNTATGTRGYLAKTDWDKVNSQSSYLKSDAT